MVHPPWEADPYRDDERPQPDHGPGVSSDKLPDRDAPRLDGIVTPLEGFTTIVDFAADLGMDAVDEGVPADAVALALEQAAKEVRRYDE